MDVPLLKRVCSVEGASRGDNRTGENYFVFNFKRLLSGIYMDMK